MTASTFIVDVSEATFENEVLTRSHAIPVLVDFWAEWCAPCKMLMPLLAKIVADYQGKFLLAKVDTDEEQRLAGIWQVRSLPTVKLFVNGAVVDEFMGVQPESAIRALLDRYLTRASDTMAQEAQDLLAQGQQAAALRLLREAVTADSDNARLPVILIQALLDTGNYREAQETLQSMPLNIQTQPDMAALGARLSFAVATSDSPDKTTLMARILEDDNDLESRMSLASCHVVAGDYEAALLLLLEVLRRDKNYRNGQVRENILRIFTMLGSSDPLVSKYRPQMAKILL